MRVSDPSKKIYIKFSLIKSAREQESHHITYVTENKLHFLMPGHSAIDAVFVAENSMNTKYLVLIQVSLSRYAKHEAKHTDICKKFKGAIHCSSSILQYYDTISEIDISNTMYLYVSSNKLMNEVQLDLIFDLPSEQPKNNYLVGLLDRTSEVAHMLKCISKSKY